MTTNEQNKAAALALLVKYANIRDQKIQWEDLDGKRHAATIRQVINAIPMKYMRFVDEILIDNDGIWVFLKCQYDFNDCGCNGGTCHENTLKAVKELFNCGIIERKEA